MKRVLLVAAAGTALLYACTLTRNLDYLSNGGDDAGSPQSSTSSSGNTQTSTSSSGTTTSSSSGQLAGTVLAPNQFAPANLVQDTANIYWTTDDNQIMKLAKSAAGGTPPTQLTKLDGGAQQIVQAVVDSSPTGNVYVLLDAGTVQIVPKAGGAAAEFASVPTPMQADAIAVDDANLYLLASSDPNGDDNALVLRFPKTPPVSSTQIAQAGTTPTTLVLSTDSIFWAASDANGNFVLEELAKTAAAGATPATFSNTLQDQGSRIGISPSEPYELDISGQTAFWLDDTEGKVYSQSLGAPSGTATALLGEQAADTFYAITTDGTNVYVTTSTDTNASAVLRVKVGTTTPDSFNVNPNPTEVIVDDTSVYVAFDGADESATQGGILKLAK